MRAERLVALLFTLYSKRSATVAELAKALDVSERTMHRDIAALRDAGVPLWTEPGRHGGVRLVDGWRTHLDGLTSREAVAIFAMGVPQALAELGLGTAMSAAHAKLVATLPPTLREQAQAMAQRFHLDAPGWFSRADDAEHLAAIAKAVWEQRRIEITYGRHGRTVRRTLQPLGIVLKAGVWYLIAEVDGDFRTYRVARIDAVKETGESFERPAAFDLVSWWKQSSAQFERSLWTVAVQIRLSPAGVRALPAILDPDAAIKALDQAGPPEADGWTQVTVELEEPRIAASQLIALGGEVEVLAPPAVRTAFAEIVRRMAERHR
ncbi:helix-turn-helix transcriptional regulator [Kutzneria kofuensis]|uniref:Putative DNA-binding transcriptional regulator YafY n=1 Tax=Kutzneria kofuensis TaxID=103725 RepID=A0A7W9NGY6_9PSEU|nr:YafY family protein [Kutzneria kofuensis]MBB5892987.1 putative DNA-binding transcriptional regulator YafY [Kutzneria kofuensis]